MTGSRAPLRAHDGYALAAYAAGAGRPSVVVPNGAYYLGDLSPLWRDQAAVAYDLRNRGGSQAIADDAALAGAIDRDVADLEAARQQLGMASMILIAHSYVTEIVLRYAMAHPARVRRLVLFAPSGHLLGLGAPPPPDDRARAVFQALAALGQSPIVGDEVQRCRHFWDVLAPLYVVDEQHAPRVAAWGRCADANERAFRRYWARHVEPSLARQTLTPADLARVAAPVLIVHGACDRSAPLSASQAWAARLPNAELLVVPDVAHAPWLEAPDVVLPKVAAFLRDDSAAHR